jgi:predicted dehydrogenase
MIKVKIYGAGSIGNHLAYACRSKGWDVTLCDIDTEALKRTKNDIYPSRYGLWDEKIKLLHVSELKPIEYDLVIIGTPPDTHIKLALKVLRDSPPKALLIEKPFCTPSLSGCQELLALTEYTGTFVAVGYNHILTKNTMRAVSIIKEGRIGKPLSISAEFREHWGGIFKAHSWLNGPQDTYLGFFDRGGGACGEHSHAINIWQHFSHVLGMGRITEVSAMMDIVKTENVEYDRLCQLSVRSKKCLVGTIVQDVITEPARKVLRVQGTEGFIECHVNYDNNNDAVICREKDGETHKELISKSRPVDFIGEIDHIQDVLEGNVKESPISLEKGLDTMMVIAAAHSSHKLGRTVRIDYGEGYNLNAINSLLGTRNISGDL